MSSLLLIIFTSALFLGAFLAFALQPMVAKMVLPHLGGVPAVWNTCMVFYQVILLGGYAYSHILTTRLRLRNQLIVHSVVLLLPLLLLPITFPSSAQPPGEANPIPWLLGVLFIAVAPPFFAVTATSPLLQRWFTSTRHPHARDPYFLYATSNLGSLLALLAYPLFFERFFTTTVQSNLWSIGYGFAAVTIMVGGFTTLRGRAGGEMVSSHSIDRVKERRGPGSTSRPWHLWILYAFLPSSLLLGLTQYLSTDIAVVPLLWIVPLAMYLLSFIFVFARKPPISHELMLKIFPGALAALVLLLLIHASQPLVLIYPIHMLTFFLAAMVCHGEMVRLRPPSSDLTKFYLWIALGGALGGLFNALIAPILFKGVAEYPIVLFLTALALPRSRDQAGRAEWPKDILLVGILVLVVVSVPLVLMWLGLDVEANFSRIPLYAVAAFLCYLGSRNRRRFGLAVGGLLLAGLVFPAGGGKRTLFTERSFFGVNRVIHYEENGEVFHNLIHGTTHHGLQNMEASRRAMPLLYYHPLGPSGDIFQHLSTRAPEARVGAIGLGSGALAAYGTMNQHWTFYEIDPVVEKIATDPRFFTYLQDSKATWDIVLGDGRLSIAEAPAENFDLIVVDAYGSDAIPVHTITQEAVELYMSKLVPGGLVAFHISNVFMDLEPVLAGIAESLGLQAFIRDDDAVSPAERAQGRAVATWVILARRVEDLGPLPRMVTWEPVGSYTGSRVWTDTYTDLFSVIRWR